MANSSPNCIPLFQILKVLEGFVPQKIISSFRIEKLTLPHRTDREITTVKGYGDSLDPLVDVARDGE